MNMIPYAIVSAWCVVAASASGGDVSEARTDRFCPNVTAVSASGKYRFDSTHPNNSLAQPQPFVCTGFTIKLTDTTTGAAVWERTQGPTEYAAAQAWVCDDGRVVVNNGTRHLLNAATGADGYTWKEHAGLGEPDRPFIKEKRTTAGVLTNIDLMSRRRLLEHDGALYFATRYFWGKRTFVHLDEHRVVETPDDALVRAAEDADRRFVRTTLERAATLLTGGGGEWDAKKSAEARGAELAAFLAGQMKMTETIPLLRKMEACDYVSIWGAGTGRSWPGTPRMKLYSLRRAAHTALRRLGERAGSEPAYTLLSGSEWREPEGGKAMERAQLPSAVKVGMQANTLFATAGAPDWGEELFDERDASGFVVLWEYDIDADTPSTLRVYISAAGEVTKVVNVRPATWSEGFQRDVGDW